MRQAIKDQRYADFVRKFVGDQFGKEPVPEWVVDALKAAGIDLGDSQTTGKV